ncbi:MAG: S8 family serine peptidase [Acidobacteriota bacterium]
MAYEFGKDIDSFLYHLIGESPALVGGQGRDGARKELAGRTFAVSQFPILVQVRTATWDSSILGFDETSRLGDVVAGFATLEALRELEADPDVVRVDLSREAGEEDLAVSVPAVHADRVHVRPNSERGGHALVGIIDSGLDVLHECLTNEQDCSRVVAYWDQRDNTGPPPRGEEGRPLYGTLHADGDIARYLRSGTVPSGLGRDELGHGTHVTSIAAGRAVGSFSGGLAPDAGIVFVRPKLCASSADPRSVGFALAHVDALAFIDRIAEERDLPVVVNLSLGMNAGAHDGSSLLEVALDNFTSGGRMPGRVLVKSAGNAAREAAHARFEMAPQQESQLSWSSASIDRDDDVIELWYDSAADLTFRLRAPEEGGITPRLHRGKSPSRMSGTLRNGNAFSMTLDRYHRDNGDTRVSLRLTRGRAARIAEGTWTLDISSGEVLSTGVVHAWVERRRGAPVRFLDHVESRSSLSIPGTAHAVITVAALDRGMTGRATSFSSRGATRDGRERPDIGAPGDGIVAARSGTRDDVISLPGSSMAAPHVTGAVALLLSRQHAKSPGAQINANQVRAALLQSSSGFDGRWSPARGWGKLDVEALLEQF